MKPVSINRLHETGFMKITAQLMEGKKKNQPKAKTQQPPKHRCTDGKKKPPNKPGRRI